MRTAGEGNLGEGDAEGEFEVGHRGAVAEGALDFSAALGEALGDDEDGCAGICGEMTAAPEGAGG